jgi:two-component system, NtrC family, response regulator AtoC
MSEVDAVKQDLLFLRGHVQRLGRLIDALEASPLLVKATSGKVEEAPTPEPEKMDAVFRTPIRTMAELEKEVILAAYKATNRDINKACKLVGIGKTTFYQKIRKYRLETSAQ